MILFVLRKSTCSQRDLHLYQQLEEQPKSAKYVKLHFDRKAARKPPSADSTFGQDRARIVEQGAWSVLGRRKAQEDTFGM
jgi:hypothetical protein